MNIKIIEDPVEFNQYEAAWNSLLSHSSNNQVFLTHEWMKTWWDVFGKKKKLFVLVVEDKGQPIGIVPMYVIKRKAWGILPLRRVHFLGNEVVGSDFLDFIVFKGREKEVIDTVVDYFVMDKSWDQIIFEDVDSESPYIGFLRSYLMKTPLSFQCYLRYSCPYLVLPGTWDQFMEMPDLESKKMVKKNVSRLYRDHQVDIQHSVPEDQMENYLLTLFKLHGERWAGTKGDGIFQNEELREFYRKIARAFSRQGWLRLAALQVDSRVEAMEFGIFYGHRYYSLQSGCSMEGLKLKAGNVLAYKLFESLIGSTEIYHFLRGSESYKYNWGGLNKHTINIDVFRGLKGRIAWITHRCSENFKLFSKMLLFRKIRPRD